MTARLKPCPAGITWLWIYVVNAGFQHDIKAPY
jgi:hypothetical protein